MSKILVTGATGFVGRTLVPALIRSGHSVRCAVSQKVRWLQADQVLINRLECQSDWSEALEGMDIVIHLAARVHIMNDTSNFPLDEYCKVNSIATKNLAEQAAQHQIKRFVFLSSIKVNGEFTVDGAPFTEDSVTNPDDPYGQSKLFAEEYLQEISQQTDMEVVIIRPPLIYGPGVKANFLKMIQLVNKGWPLPFAKVQNKRSFVYIYNLVSALCRVAVAPEAANKLYLVADNEAWSLPELLTVLGEKMNRRARLIAVPVSLMSKLFNLFRLTNLNVRLFGSLEVSNHKIKSDLHWSPPVHSADGLAETIKWFQSR